MDEQAQRDLMIEMGMRVEDFAVSAAGKFLIQRYQQKVGLEADYMIFQRKKEGFAVKEPSEFYHHRGFANGVQWAIDEIRSVINVAKRFEKERQEKLEETKS
jgi:hypothetical protein